MSLKDQSFVVHDAFFFLEYFFYLLNKIRPLHHNSDAFASYAAKEDLDGIFSCGPKKGRSPVKGSA